MKKIVLLAAGAVLLCAVSFFLGRALSPAVPPAPLPGPAASAPPARPNVVWLVLDSCRYDHLSCYGYPVTTSPAIDKLAKAGVLFENNYVQGLLTRLSVPSYVSGQLFPASCLFNIFGRETPRIRPADQKYMSEIFEENGYSTLFASSHGLMRPQSPLFQSFDRATFVASQDRFPTPTMHQMLPAIKDLVAAGARSGKPYFLYIHVMETHFPHRGAGKWSADTYVSDDIRDGMPIGLTGCSFDEEEKECMRNLHDSSIMGADRAFGELMAFLEDRGEAENTLFVVTSDHGELLGEDGTRWGHEIHIADPVLRTPLILAGPGLPADARVPGLTRSLDILPTLVDLLDLRTDAGLEGVSLMPLVRGEKEETGEPVLSRAGGYEEDITLILVSREHRYEHTLETGEEKVFAADDAGGRELEGVAPEVLANYRDTLLGAYLPRWERYQAYPRTFHLCDFRKEFTPDTVSPRDRIVMRDGDGDDLADRADNQWTFSKGVLWAATPTEKAPPITMTFPLEPGKYGVWVILVVMKPDNAAEGASVTVQLPGGAPVDATWNPPPRDHQPENYFYAGEVQVDHGGCAIVVSPGRDDHWAALRGVKFFRLDGGVLHDTTSPSVEEVQENMRALGYLN